MTTLAVIVAVVGIFGGRRLRRRTMVYVVRKTRTLPFAGRRAA